MLARRLRETGDKGRGSRMRLIDDNGTGRLSLVDSLARVVGVRPRVPDIQGLIVKSPLASMGNPR